MKLYSFSGLSAEYGCIVVDNMLEHDAKAFTMRELRVYHSEKVFLFILIATRVL